MVLIRKEKQEEEKGKLGAAGLLSKEGRPLIDHLIDSEQKYKSLRETMDQKIAVLFKFQNFLKVLIIPASPT